MRWQKWLTNHTLISEAAASIIYVDLYEDSSLNEILNPYLCLFPFFYQMEIESYNQYKKQRPYRAILVLLCVLCSLVIV